MTKLETKMLEALRDVLLTFTRRKIGVNEFARVMGLVRDVISEAERAMGF